MFGAVEIAGGGVFDCVGGSAVDRFLCVATHGVQFREHAFRQGGGCGSFGSLFGGCLSNRSADAAGLRIGVSEVQWVVGAGGGRGECGGGVSEVWGEDCGVILRQRWGSNGTGTAKYTKYAKAIERR